QMAASHATTDAGTAVSDRDLHHSTQLPSHAIPLLPTPLSNAPQQMYYPSKSTHTDGFEEYVRHSSIDALTRVAFRPTHSMIGCFAVTVLRCTVMCVPVCDARRC